jgi:hypothetical protein
MATNMRFGDYALIDDAQPVQPKDHADDDVRNAVRIVEHNERKDRYVDEYGPERLRTAEGWGIRAQEIGPPVAREVRISYENAPRSSAPAKAEEEASGDDWTKAARSAFRTASGKPTASEREHGRQVVDRMELRHNGLDILDRFKDIDEQFRKDPVDAERRLAAEIATSHNDAILNNQALQEVRSYEAKHQFGPDERQMMQHLLLTGQAADMPSAHKQAKHLLALDIEDPYRRQVTASQRQLQAPEMAKAVNAVAEFESRYPDARSDGPRWERVRRILEAGKAPTIDAAWHMTRPSRT